LAFISFLFKRKYPIYSEKMMMDIQISIKLQKDFIKKAKDPNSEKYDFYLIKNPVYDSKHIHLL
jgi:hypothetical protein